MVDIRDNRLYSQLEIIQLSKLPPTTVKRWLAYFSDYVFSMRQNDFTAYGFETVTLMKRIDELRKQKYHLRSIRRILREEGFPVKKESEIAENSGEKQMTALTEHRPPGRSDAQQIQLLTQALNIVEEGLRRISFQLEELCKQEQALSFPERKKTAVK
jgi:DNA-binding transcriptional MerR regulator